MNTAYFLAVKMYGMCTVHFAPLSPPCRQQCICGDGGGEGGEDGIMSCDLRELFLGNLVSSLC
jgi:hypothetical protein